MGILLYHRTSKKSANNIKKHGVDLSYSRKTLDFGVGFYWTSNKYVDKTSYEKSRAESRNIRFIIAKDSENNGNDFMTNMPDSG